MYTKLVDGGGQGIDAPGNPDRPVAPIITTLKFYIPDKIKPARTANATMNVGRCANNK